MSARTLAAFFAVLALVGLLAFGLFSKGDARIAIGDPVPDKQLPVLGGKGERAISDYRGRWVLVNLWASWCTPCRKEAPELERFAQRYRNDDVTVLGINVQDNSDDALGFLNSYPTTYPQLRSIGDERSAAFGATGVPENFLVDPHGRLALALPSPVDERLLQEQFVPIIEGSQ